jgi:hypothetical protein
MTAARGALNPPLLDADARETKVRVAFFERGSPRLGMRTSHAFCETRKRRAVTSFKDGLQVRGAWGIARFRNRSPRAAFSNVRSLL